MIGIYRLCAAKLDTGNLILNKNFMIQPHSIFVTSRSSISDKPELKIPGAAVKAFPDHWLWCSAKGTPPVYIAIMKNGNVLTNSTGYTMVRVNEEGTYRCVANNKVGMDSKDMQVTLSASKFIFISFQPLRKFFLKSLIIFMYQLHISY